MASVLKSVSLASVRENPVALRSVNRESEEFKGLVDSIKGKGFLGTVTVREKTDEGGTLYYELVDGLHRYAAAKDAGIKEINVHVVSMTDGQVLEAQIMSNVHKIETKLAEYSKQLLRLLTMNPMMTEAELATRLGKSPAWLKARLGIAKIDNKDIQTLIDESKIPLSNAFALAKLPDDEMADFVDRAMTLPPDEFMPLVQNRVKEVNDAKRKGKLAAPAEFIPIPHLRKLKELKEEAGLVEGVQGGQIAVILVKEAKIKKPEDAFVLGIKWALNYDSMSIAAQKEKNDQIVQAREAAKTKRAAERAQKKAEDAAVAQQKAQEAAEELAKRAATV